MTLGTMPEVTPEMLQMVADHQAMMKNSASMHFIASEMKELGELPSEKPTDVHPLDRVEFPDKGGVLTYMGGYEHPYKGFPFFEFVDKIDFMKKTQRAVLSSFYHSIKKSKWKILFIPFILSDLTRAFIYTFYRMIDRFKLKPIRYCDMVREVYRSFTVNSEGDEMTLMVRDIVCMLLEMDNAYRYRFQDIIVELDQTALEKKPIREINRMMRTLSSRETTQEIKDTWKLVRYFLPVYLFMNKDLGKKIVNVLGGLNLQLLELSVEDKSFCTKRKDYNFNFMQRKVD